MSALAATPAWEFEAAGNLDCDVDIDRLDFMHIM